MPGFSPTRGSAGASFQPANNRFQLSGQALAESKLPARKLTGKYPACMVIVRGVVWDVDRRKFTLDIARIHIVDGMNNVKVRSNGIRDTSQFEMALRKRGVRKLEPQRVKPYMPEGMQHLVYSVECANARRAYFLGWENLTVEVDGVDGREIPMYNCHVGTDKKMYNEFRDSLLDSGDFNDMANLADIRKQLVALWTRIEGRVMAMQQWEVSKRETDLGGSLRNECIRWIDSALDLEHQFKGFGGSPPAGPAFADEMVQERRKIRLKNEDEDESF